eukprot:1194464-Prorocentrum_minimum.AAC.1
MLRDSTPIYKSTVSYTTPLCKLLHVHLRGAGLHVGRRAGVVLVALHHRQVVHKLPRLQLQVLRVQVVLQGAGAAIRDRECSLKRRSSRNDAREPQNPTKSEEYQRHLQ